MEQDKFIALLAKQFSKEISADESKLLEDTLQRHEKHRFLAKQLEAYFNERSSKETDPNQLAKTWGKIAAFEDEYLVGQFNYTAPKQTLLSSTLFKVAAVLVLAFTVGLFAYQFLSRNNGVDTLVASEQKVFKVLDDGTSIWLNKKSNITYNKNFGKNKREIFLNGEAYFDVVKNAAVPLIIHAGGIDIDVKGTVFNVNAYSKNNGIQVALIRGSIAVTDRQNSKNSVLLKPNDKLFFSAKLTQSETAFQIVKLNPVVLLKDASWVADTLNFNKEKLRDLALKLEKKYDVKIEIRGEILKEKRFSGTFTNETIHQALEALKLSYPLIYTVNQRLVIIKD